MQRCEKRLWEIKHPDIGDGEKEIRFESESQRNRKLEIPKWGVGGVVSETEGTTGCLL